jgi:hypothetical protein
MFDGRSRARKAGQVYGANVGSAAVADLRSVSPKSMAESCHSAWSRGACAAFLAGHFKRELAINTTPSGEVASDSGLLLRVAQPELT